MADSNSLNQFIIVGFVGQDPELKTAKDPNRKFLILDVATQERYRGREKPKVVWHRLQIWGTKLAPWAAGAVKKGMQICAKGRLDTRFVGPQGDRVRIVDLKVEEFVLLRKKAPEPDQAGPVPGSAPAKKDPY